MSRTRRRLPNNVPHSTPSVANVNFFPRACPQTHPHPITGWGLENRVGVRQFRAAVGNSDLRELDVFGYAGKRDKNVKFAEGLARTSLKEVRQLVEDRYRTGDFRGQ